MVSPSRATYSMGCIRLHLPPGDAGHRDRDLLHAAVGGVEHEPPAPDPTSPSDRTSAPRLSPDSVASPGQDGIHAGPHAGPARIEPGRLPLQPTGDDALDVPIASRPTPDVFARCPGMHLEGGAWPRRRNGTPPRCRAGGPGTARVSASSRTRKGVRRRCWSQAGSSSTPRRLRPDRYQFEMRDGFATEPDSSIDTARITPAASSKTQCAGLPGKLDAIGLAFAGARIHDVDLRGLDVAMEPLLPSADLRWPVGR